MVDILDKNHCLVVWDRRLCPLPSRHLNLLPQQGSITPNLNYFTETGEGLSGSENVIRAATEIGAGSCKRLKRQFWGTAPWDAFRVWLAASASVVWGFFCCRIFLFFFYDGIFHLHLWNEITATVCEPHARLRNKLGKIAQWARCPVCI